MPMGETNPRWHITTKKSKCLSMIYDNIKKYGLDEILESYLVRGQFELAVHMKKKTNQRSGVEIRTCTMENVVPLV